MIRTQYPKNKLRIAPCGHERGFHSLITQYLAVCRRHLNKLVAEKITPYMDLSRKATGYHSKDDIHFLQNPWNNYFVQEPLKENELFWAECCDFSTDLTISPGHSPKADFLIWKEIKDKYLIIQPHILNKVDQFVDQYFSGKVAGIHIRGTDSFFDKTRPHLPISYYVKLIEEKLISYNKILLCTDSLEISTILKNTFGNRIINYDSEKVELDKYRFHLSYISEDPYKIGEDVLIESLLMAKCDLLVRSYSNVSAFALIENPTMAFHQVDDPFFLPEHINRGSTPPFSKEYYNYDLEISDMYYYLEKSKEFEYNKFKALETGNHKQLTELIKNYFYS
jgi:hypothetical protein